MNLSNKEQLEDTIARTRELLNHLEADNIEDAQQLIDTFNKEGEDELFSEIGKLTRTLHEALTNFHLDDKFTNLAAAEIPDARERLNFVIEKTEDAANKTMDKVEDCNRLADELAKDSEVYLEQWQKLWRRELSGKEFKSLCEDTEKHLRKNKQSAVSLHEGMTEVLMAQDYQDLTGQVLRTVITLVHDVEESMVNVIKVFGNMTGYDSAKDAVVVTEGVEGPIIDAEKRDDVLDGQDEVDDLLSSLGF